MERSFHLMQIHLVDYLSTRLSIATKEAPRCSQGSDKISAASGAFISRISCEEEEKKMIFRALREIMNHLLLLPGYLPLLNLFRQMFHLLFPWNHFSIVIEPVFIPPLPTSICDLRLPQVPWPQQSPKCLRKLERSKLPIAPWAEECSLWLVS